jgi:hypothetical protein
MYGLLCTVVHCPTFFEPYTSFNAPSSNTSKFCLSIYTVCIFVGYTNHMTDRSSQAVGNSIFMFNFTATVNVRRAGVGYDCTGQYSGV